MNKNSLGGICLHAVKSLKCRKSMKTAEYAINDTIIQDPSIDSNNLISVLTE